MTHLSDSSPKPAPRLVLPDVMRAAAVAAMVVYHAAWDLSHVGLIATDVPAHAGWTALARSIAAVFLFVAGVSAGLAADRPLAAHIRRSLTLALAAAAISVTTRLVLPDMWIHFGILHHMALAGLLVLPLLRAPGRVVALLAAFVLSLPLWAVSPAFDGPMAALTGLATRPPRTADFVPFAPWFGFVLAGLAAVRFVRPRRDAAREPTGPVTALLVAVGRRSLPIYLLHQPVLFALALGLAEVLPVDRQVEMTRFDRSCQAGCLNRPGGETTCPAYCGCLVEALGDTGFFAIRGGDPAHMPALSAAVTTCSAAGTVAE